MRRRSGAILAENINDYFSQMNILSKNFEIENSNYDISNKLFDFDYLSLNDNNLTFEENDLLSSKKTYRICLIDVAKKFQNLKKKRILIPLKVKKNQKKKRGFVLKSKTIF
jgi:hypothetical protein